MTPSVYNTPNQGVLRLESYNRTERQPAGSGIKGFVALGALIVAGFVGGAVYWAKESKLDGAVVASASFVVEGNRKTVEHLDGGIVRSILVTDGDLVEAGQTLIELDSTDLDVNLDVITSQLGELIVRRARLIAQIRGQADFQRGDIAQLSQPLLDSRDWAGAFETQKMLFYAETGTRSAEKELLEQRVSNLQDQIEGLGAQRQANARQTDITREELDDLETLFAKGLVAANRVNNRRVEIERLLGLEAALATQMAQARNQISELQLAAIGEQTQRAQAASDELAQVEAQLAALLPQFAGATERRKRVVVTAPVDGRIVGMTVFTSGGVVRPGEAILEIVPADQPLIVEAQVNTTDIEKLFVGQSARVRLSAFDQGEVPEATGRIIDISADSIEDDRTGEPYFLAQVRLDPKQSDQVAALELVPGMPADLFVNTGERTALSFLAQPLQDRLARTFIE